nr:MAG: Prophage endopeptidase tail [Bacteriophage sp.]
MSKKGANEMDFYVTDRTFELKTIISTTGTVDYPVISATDVTTLETASRRMTMQVGFTKENTGKIKKDIAVGNYVLYQDLNQKFIWMTILKVSHNPLTQIRTLECEDAGLDLLNENLEPFPSQGNHNIAWYINKFTYDSGFVIGKNEIPNLTRALEWDSNMTALERIQSVATQFDNAELEFSFEFNGNQLIQRKIDIYKKRGVDERKKLYVNKDINYIETEEDIYQLVNAIYPTGGTPEGKEAPINLKGYTWTDPTGRFVLDKNSGYVKDTHNIKQWSRTNTTSNYFLQHKNWTTTNQKELLDTTINWLKKYSEPIVTYVVDIANTPSQLTVGDTLDIIDENEQLYLSSRVQKLTVNYETEQMVCELSDFVRLESGLSDKLQSLANDLKNDLNSKLPYEIFIEASSPLFIGGKTQDGGTTITLSAKVRWGGKDVTNIFEPAEFTWSRYKSDGTKDTNFTATGRVISVTSGDESQFKYEVELNY